MKGKLSISILSVVLNFGWQSCVYRVNDSVCVWGGMTRVHAELCHNVIDAILLAGTL